MITVINARWLNFTQHFRFGVPHYRKITCRHTVAMIVGTITAVSFGRMHVTRQKIVLFNYTNWKVQVKKRWCLLGCGQRFLRFQRFRFNISITSIMPQRIRPFTEVLPQRVRCNHEERQNDSGEEDTQGCHREKNQLSRSTAQLQIDESLLCSSFIYTATRATRVLR